MSDDDSAEDELIPPAPSRVAARALALSAVTCRGFVEQEAEQARSFWLRAREWFLSLGIDDEFEARERRTIDTPLGGLERQAQIDATWLSEGMAVLAWALGRSELPPYDSPVVAGDVANSLGFLCSLEETVLARPSLRPLSELEACREEIFAIHWRLRDFSIRPTPIDFAEFARNAWFGPLRLGQARLVDGDLAVGGVTIALAPQMARAHCMSIAQERHRAANWLCGYGEVYSEVDTST